MKQWVDAKAPTHTKSNCNNFVCWYRTYERGKEKKANWCKSNYYVFKPISKVKPNLITTEHDKYCYFFKEIIFTFKLYFNKWQFIHISFNKES